MKYGGVTDVKSGSVPMGTTWSTWCAEDNIKNIGYGSDLWRNVNGFVFNHYYGSYVADSRGIPAKWDDPIVFPEYGEVYKLPTTSFSVTFSETDGARHTYDYTAVKGETWSDWCTKRNAEFTASGFPDGDYWRNIDGYVYGYVYNQYVIGSNGYPVLWNDYIESDNHSARFTIPAVFGARRFKSEEYWEDVVPKPSFPYWENVNFTVSMLAGTSEDNTDMYTATCSGFGIPNNYEDKVLIRIESITPAYPEIPTPAELEFRLYDISEFYLESDNGLCVLDNVWDFGTTPQTVSATFDNFISTRTAPENYKTIPAGTYRWNSTLNLDNVTPFNGGLHEAIPFNCTVVSTGNGNSYAGRCVSALFYASGLMAYLVVETEPEYPEKVPMYVTTHEDFKEWTGWVCFDPKIVTLKQDARVTSTFYNIFMKNTSIYEGKALKSIHLDPPPKEVYTIGESWDAENTKIVCEYWDGTTEQHDLEDTYIHSQPNLSVTGNTQLKVVYSDTIDLSDEYTDNPDGVLCTCQYDIKVQRARQFTRLYDGQQVFSQNGRAFKRLTPLPEFNGYISIISPDVFTLSNGSVGKTWNGTIEYSTDTINWNEWNGTSVLSSNDDGKLYMRGTGNTGICKSTTEYTSGTWEFTGSNISISGKLESLLDYDTVIHGNHPTMRDYAFYRLFIGNPSITDASELDMGAETLSQSCYRGMFQSCTNLKYAPDLPATTLAAYCYAEMFSRCKGLIGTINICASTLAESCCYNMFYYCESLETAPSLPATSLAAHCYEGMFSNCVKLTTAPDLPATVLKESCYAQMFYYCVALVVAPNLLATSLADYCYFSMFEYCTKLKSISKLPAATLAKSCYMSMYMGCHSLLEAPQIYAEVLAEQCCMTMFADCTSLKVLPYIARATELKPYCYWGMLYGCSSVELYTKGATGHTNRWYMLRHVTGTADNALTDMLCETSGDAPDTPVVGTVYYTSNLSNGPEG